MKNSGKFTDWRSAKKSEVPKLRAGTPGPLLTFLADISARWPSLVFLLDYDREETRFKGLARAKGGKLRHWRVSY
jgi:hypothetical protein